VVSAGVNFFSPGANTSIFGKVDVAFGDETEGVSARGGSATIGKPRLYLCYGSRSRQSSCR
jgi:hypothetical protein